MARKMKDSGIEWIGEIPEGWEVVQLKRFAEVHNGREIDVEVDSTDSSAVGVYGSGGVFKYTNRAQYSGKAVLFGRKGTLGKPLYVEGQLWAVDTMYFLTYSNRLLEKFSYYQFLAFNWAPYITHTAIPSVVASEIVACYFPIPPLEEQAKIADYLDNGCASLDTILDKTRSSIEEYKKLKQAVITQAVTKGVRGKREMKDSGVEWIGEIPVEWSVAKAKYYVTITHGSDPKTEGSIPVYGSGAESFKTCGEYKEGPTVLIGRKGATLHIPHYIEGKYWNVDTAFDVKAKNNFFLPYYYYLATSFDYKFYIAQTTLPGMTQSNYYNMFLPLPTFPEQEEIVNYLDAKCAEIDKLIAKKEQLAKELESYKKSLIYEVVTGKREV